MESSNTTDARKVILISKSNYSSEHEDVLKALIKRNIELFCAIGTDCEKWEEAVDWLCIDEKGNKIGFVNTTSHPDETIEEVMDFAKNWSIEGNNEIQVIEI